MPLQIRRGPTADRLTITPLEGELVYDTNTGSVYIGNGVTAGGIPITSLTSTDVKNLAAELFLGPIPFTDNSLHSGITFNYAGGRLTATISDTLSGVFKGSFFAEDSGIIIDGTTKTLFGDLRGNLFSDNGTTLLVDADNVSINLNGTVKGNVIPDTDSSYDLGSNSNKFNNLYLSSAGLFLGNAQLTSVGTAIDLPTGSTVNGAPLGLEAGLTYDINVRGDVIGSVFADDSTWTTFGDSTRQVPLVDATNGQINLDGTVKGNIIPDVGETYNIGSDDYKFSRLYLAESLDSMYVGNATLGSVGTTLTTPTFATNNLAIRTTVTPSSPVVFATQGNFTEAMNVVFSRSRGTLATAPSAAFNGDQIGNILFQAFDGTQNTAAAVIRTVTDGAISSGVVPGRILFGTARQGTGTIETGVTIDNTGRLNALAGMTLENLGTTAAGDYNLRAARSRGSLTSPTAVLSGDNIYNIVSLAYDGTSFVQSSTISTQVEGTISTGIAPGRLVFATANSSGVTTTGLVLDSNQRTTALGGITVPSDFDNTDVLILSGSHATAGDSVNLAFRRSRGTTASPLATGNGDFLGDINFTAYDGTNFNTMVSLRGKHPTPNNTAGSLDIVIRNTVGTLATRVSITPTAMAINVMPILPTFADETAANASVVGVPLNGMMYYDGSLGKIRGYQAGSWVNLA